MLVVDDAGGAEELVDVWITFSSEIGEVLVGLLGSGFQSCCDITANIAYSLETGHLISDGGLSGKKVRLLGTQPVSFQAHELGQCRELGPNLVVHLGMELEEFWVRRARGSELWELWRGVILEKI